MPSTQEFRRRIKSVNNTKQITKAMEMIASIKMQKAVRAEQQLKVYVQDSWNLLVDLAKLTSPEDHPLLMPKESDSEAIILVTSDRGLCGSYNSDILKKFNAYLSSVISTPRESRVEKSFMKDPSASVGMTQKDNVDIIAIGKKGAAFIRRYNKGNLIAEFPFKDEVYYDDIIPIAKMAIDGYETGNYSRVSIVYSHFQSSIKQTPVIKQVLPISPEHIDIPELWQSPDSLPAKDRVSGGGNETEFKFEPSPDAVLNRILPQFIRMQIFGAMIEANASEHSARMVAMKNSTDNAKDLIDELTLAYNSIRQNNITGEIAEISSVAEAMK